MVHVCGLSFVYYSFIYHLLFLENAAKPWLSIPHICDYRWLHNTILSLVFLSSSTDVHGLAIVSCTKQK